MILEAADDARRWTKRRLRRHGNEYDLVMEHFINGKPAVLGTLFKSYKTGKYVWFDRSQLKPIPFYDGDIIPEIIEDVSTYTPDKELLYDYLDHLMCNVLSKRDQKKYGPIYDKIKYNELSLLERFGA